MLPILNSILITLSNWTYSLSFALQCSKIKPRSSWVGRKWSNIGLLCRLVLPEGNRNDSRRRRHSSLQVSYIRAIPMATGRLFTSKYRPPNYAAKGKRRRPGATSRPIVNTTSASTGMGHLEISHGIYQEISNLSNRRRNLVAIPSFARNSLKAHPPHCQNSLQMMRSFCQPVTNTNQIRTPCNDSGSIIRYSKV